MNLTCIIDDDPIAIFTTRKLMERNRFPKKCLVYNNGKEAINGFISRKKLQAELPDLIFLDLNMPIMDGWQFLDAYRDLKLDIVLHIVSSSISKKDLEKAKSNDLVTSYIIKPLDDEVLITIKRSFKNKN